ncbi:MAG: hypothetical protein HN392_06970 [Anaerolineae bacterium]|jgi:hypothetical protein|nr:hypothetical protein [Anaerolineae bacterium]MBT7075531.1 hypothetical protein [Anaerolineae bacterium]MBT7782562.1 hypothetical protein [Anaerolineae bacterium]
MVAFYNFLSAYEGMIYFILILGGVFLGRWLWRTWREWDSAIFGLEREVSRKRFARAIGANALWLAFFLGTFIFTSFIIPSMPPSTFIPTPTVDLLITPTGTISAEMAATLSARPEPQAEDYSDGCIPDQIIVNSPVPGQSLSGIVELVGTVDIPKFGFYKFEVSPTGVEKWSTIYAGRTVIQDDILGRIDTSELTPGDYALRLIVADNTGESLPPCIIQVRVTGQVE